MNMKRKNSGETILEEIADVILCIGVWIWESLKNIWGSDAMDFFRFASTILGGVILLIVLVAWALSFFIHFPTYEERLEFYTQSYNECIEQETISIQSCEKIARYHSGLGD